jgi:hypothetical protein
MFSSSALVKILPRYERVGTNEDCAQLVELSLVYADASCILVDGIGFLDYLSTSVDFESSKNALVHITYHI